MEENYFRRPAVSRILSEKYVEARLHTDHEELGEKWVELERRYVGYSAQAMYVVFDPVSRKALRMRSFPQGDVEATMIRFLEGRRAVEVAGR